VNGFLTEYAPFPVYFSILKGKFAIGHPALSQQQWISLHLQKLMDFLRGGV
jgi:hypothetical protein